MFKDIAIIGIGGRFPEADGVDQFYRNLRAGRNSVREVSFSRKYHTGLDVNKDYRIFGSLENIDCFDYSFFDISLGEARFMDPHQRLLLEVVYNTIENAGYSADDLKGSHTAVFVGDTFQQYYTLAEENNPLLITGNLNATTAGRLSRFFNFTGNALMVDTACSSSLVALHMACNEMCLGEADYAMVCGVHLVLFPEEKAAQTEVEIMSFDGLAKPFSAAANGTGIGEAVGCVLLKPLDAAVRDGDIIHAIIKGSAANQDAHRSSSLTAPSSIAQAQVIKRAWARGGVDPRSISYIETHGTGTKLGDPIEVDGIGSAFADFTPVKQFCAISSLKSNIGHADSAAGISSLIKAVLSLKHGVLFPSLHVDEPNPFIDFINSPVYINTSLQDWDRGKHGVRRAGVSSFGISGTNCHVVLEEAPLRDSVVDNPEDGSAALVTISSRTRSGLLANIGAIKEHLVSGCDYLLRDIAYTLQTGRQHFPFRFSCLADSTADLIEKLEACEDDCFSQEGRGLRELWMLFPDNIHVDPTAFRMLCGYPTFSDVYNRCIAYAGVPLTDSQRVFVLQYALYHLLEAAGISTRKVMGSGVGKLVIKVLKGEVTEADALTSADGYAEADPEGMGVRVRDFIQQQDRSHAIFLEIGSEGNLFRAFTKAYAAGVPPVHVQCVLAGTGALSFLQILRDFYLQGVSIQWKHVISGGRKVELPGYQFTRSRVWIKAPSEQHLLDSMYELSWKAEAADETPVPQGQSFLIFDDALGLADGLSQTLVAHGNTVVRVAVGNAFRVAGEHAVEMRWDEEADYLLLRTYLAERHVVLQGILLMGAYTTVPVGDHVDAFFGSTLYACLLSAKVFDQALRRKDFVYSVVTAHARHVEAGDVVVPAMSAIHGYMVSLCAEYPSSRIRVIDLVSPGQSVDAHVTSLWHELRGKRDKVVVAYRDGSAYVPAIQSFSNVEYKDPTSVALREGGVYVIAGGASGIGLEMAKYIAASQNVTLVILGRRVLPARSDWSSVASDHPLHESITALLKLASGGSRIAYYAVDISDGPRLAAVLQEVRKDFGSIRGIIHSAGIGGKGRVRHQSLSDFRDTLLAKVHGTINLYEVTRDERLDFFFLFSSLNAIIGTEKATSYSAGNIFQDHYAMTLRAMNIPARIIRWDFWNETGMGKRLNEALDIPTDLKTTLSSEEGVRFFGYIFKRGIADIIISKNSPAVMGDNPYYYFVPRKVGAPLSVVQAEVDASQTAGRYYGRIEGVEDFIKGLWVQVLQNSSLSADDNFFVLGGHSLLGARIISRIGREFGIELEFKDILSYPTIRALAGYVFSKQSKHVSSLLNGIVPIAEQPYYDLSHGQRRLWALNQIQEDEIAYNITKAFALVGRLDMAAFKRCFGELVTRHESLRTIFVTVAGEPRQSILPAHETVFEFEYLDHRHLTPAPDTQAVIQRAAAVPFMLDQWPLFRVLVVQTAEERCVVLLTMHHIITDGWSVDVLVSEVLQLYTAFARGEAAHLSPLSIQYKDYIHWQQARLSGDDLERHRTYWVGQLKDRIAALSLPTDFPRPHVKTYRGASRTVLFDAALGDAILKFGRDREVTLFMVLLSAVKVLLYRYTGINEIVVGSPMAGRDHPDLENQIGLYINTVVLRTRITEDDTFEQVVNHVKETTLGAYAHQLYPFDLLVEDFMQKRDLSRSPLFDVLVLLQNTTLAPVTGDTLNTIEVRDYPMDTGISKFDITFGFFERDGVLGLNLEYNTDLYSTVRIDQTISYLKDLIGTVIRDPSVMLGALPAAESVQNPIGSLSSLFAASVSRYPEHIAVRYGRRSFTYREIHAQADAVTDYLVNTLAVKPGDFVGILLDRSHALIASMLGILKAGAAYVPMDPEYSDQRIRYILHDSRVKALLVTHDKHRRHFSQASVNVDKLLSGVTASVNLPQLNHVSDFAAVFYTPDPAGMPKGVVISSKGLTAVILSYIDAMRLTEADASLLVENVSFIAAQKRIFGPLLSGGTVCLPAADADLIDICDSIGHFQITTLNCRDSVFYPLLEVASSTSFRQLQSLRSVVADGGLEKRPLLAAWKASDYGKANVFRAYGYTECSDLVALTKADDAGIHDGVLLPGDLLQGVSLYVLDSLLAPVSGDAVGDLYVGGACVALGYLNDDMLTRARFIELPGRSRVFYTGQRARLQGDGGIIIVAGDTDHYTGVSNVQGGETTGRTEAGVVRQAGNHVHVSFRALTAVEEKTIALWKEVLPVQHIEATDDFFQLGGHSLNAIKVRTGIYKTFQVQVSMRELFLHSTVEKLSALIEGRNRGSEERILPVGVQPHYVLSHAQKRLWILHQLSEERSSYNIPSAYELSGDVRTDIIERCFAELCRQHESLRTTFTVIDGEPRQRIGGLNTGVSVSYKDLRNFPNQADVVDAAVRENTTVVFDLEAGPLWRVDLLHVADGQYILLFTMHHIISDGWSIDILIRDFRALYQAFSNGLPNPLRRPAIQYKDYAHWQNQFLALPAAADHKAFWLKQFPGEIPVLGLPTDFVRMGAKSFRGSLVTVPIDSALFTGLQTLSHANKSSLFISLVALIKALMYSYTRQSDIVLGSISSGRDQEDMAQQVGICFNTLPLRTQFNPDQDFISLLERVKETVLSAYEHQVYPFDRLIADLGLGGNVTQNPLFNVMVIYENLNASDIENSLDGIRIKNHPAALAISKFDLTFSFKESQRGLDMSIEYDTDLYSVGRIKRMADHVCALLQDVIQRPGCAVRDYSCLPDWERRELLVTFNDTDHPYNNDTTIARLFEQQAALYPHAVAVIFNGVEMTYDELNRGANRLAHCLVEQYSVGKGDHIALAAEKSEKLIVALLAIFKSGGVYVPVDAAYPAERIRYILDDAQIATIICDASVVTAGVNRIDIESILDYSYPDNNPVRDVYADDVAYAIYTSGSTGNPKGVLIKHRSFVDRILYHNDYLNFSADGNMLQFSSIGFDASLVEIFMAFFSGAKITLATRADKGNLHSLLALMEEYRVTAGIFPPSYIKLFDKRALPGLQKIISTGEAAIFEDAMHYARTKEFYNGYGPTETCIGATFYHVHPDTLKEYVHTGRIPIGSPFANTKVYVLSEDLKLVPIGFPGEIYVSGIGLAKGYLNNDALTAARFIQNPYAESDAYALMYRTGDVGYWNDGGAIEYIGRNDNQIQINGVRVELGEISNALCASGDIEQAHVIWNDNQVVSFVQTKQKVEFWPDVNSIGIFDELLYHAMSRDEHRIEALSRVFKKHLQGKVVLDVGTGQYALLARLAAEAGAKKVYAVEIDQAACSKAKVLIQSLGLAETIEILAGDVRAIVLPEQVDYCVFDISGNIGGSGGAAVLVKHAKKWLYDKRHVIPARYLTLMSCATLPDDMVTWGFSPVAGQYVEQIFDKTGYPFDLRLSLKYFPRQNIISTSSVFEDLLFRDELLEEDTHAVELVFERESLFHGFVLSLKVMYDDSESVHNLSQEQSLLPLFIPAFYPGEAVQPGDRVMATIERRLSDNGVHPDFFISGTLVRSGQANVDFSYSSFNHSRVFKAHPFYEKLFSGAGVTIYPDFSADSLKRDLRLRLPLHMVPNRIIRLAAFPLNENGKIDNQALRALAAAKPDESVYRAPKSDTEKLLAGIWEEILEREGIGVDDNFFEIGGHSLKATQLLSRIYGDLKVKIDLKSIFNNPTIETLGNEIETLQWLREAASESDTEQREEIIL